MRMLRAVRFASKLGFRIDPDTEAPIFKFGHLLEGIPAARLYEEVLKLFLSGNAAQTFEKLRHYDLFKYLFPETDRCLAREEEGYPLTLLIHALANTDERIAQDKPVTPSFICCHVVGTDEAIDQADAGFRIDRTSGHPGGIR